MSDITDKQLVAAFAEWQREYREDPEAFASAEAVAAQTPSTYGERAARTLRRYLAKVAA